ncbi:hypothetical protein POG20_19140, partial [Blautia wexlerae]|nr:hypothetical protein [Blautia wexlerae]
MHDRSKLRRTISCLSILLIFLAAMTALPTAIAEAEAPASSSPSHMESERYTGAPEEDGYVDTLPVNPGADTGEGEVEILYYFYNRCLSCDEEATIKE